MATHHSQPGEDNLKTYAHQTQKQRRSSVKTADGQQQAAEETETLDISADTIDSPFQQRTLMREEATIDLRAHALQMQHEHRSFADAIDAHHTSLFGSIPLTPKASSTRDMHHQLEDSAHVCESDAIARAPVSSDLASQQADYARHMAESTLRRNGRELMSKPTTTVSKWHVVSYNSAYTRPLGDMLREMVDVRCPRSAVAGIESQVEGVGLTGEGEGLG